MVHKLKKNVQSLCNEKYLLIYQKNLPLDLSILLRWSNRYMVLLTVEFTGDEHLETTKKRSGKNNCMYDSTIFTNSTKEFFLGCALHT